MRKLLSFLLTLTLILTLSVPASAAENAVKSDDIVILYTNDVHTYIDGEISYDTIAGVKAYLESQYEYVLLADAGDHIQGTAYGSMDSGKTIIKMMNAAGYDVATLGNHEFDYGMTGRIKVTDNWAKHTYVSCNFYEVNGGVRGDNVLDSYKIFQMGDEKIAFVGITTPETLITLAPVYFQNEKGETIYSIAGGKDGSALYTDVQKAIDAAKADGATKIIALGHLGDDLATRPWTSEDTIANTRGLDAFIDGHSHATVEGKCVKDKAGRDVLLTQTGEYFGKIGMMVIDAETGAITTQLLTSESDIVKAATPNASVKEIKDAWMSEIDKKLGQKIGYTDLTFDNYDAEGRRLPRVQGTNSGAFAADALYYLFDNMDMDVDVAIMNGGGVRNKTITGDLTYLVSKEIHTFGNVACLQTITGQQLLDALEWGARFTPTMEVGGFLHTAGVTYEVDASIETTVQSDETGVWTGGPTGEYRVKNVQIYNKKTDSYEPLDLKAKYNLAGYNYTLRDLGDGFAMFGGAVNVLDYVMEDYMVVSNYIQGFPGGNVGASNSPLLAKYPGLNIDYSEVTGDGRIKVTAPWDGKVTIGGLTNDLWFTKYGNINTDCKAENFVEDLGITWGDTATVRFLNQELTLPVVPAYSYVNSGSPAIILRRTDAGQPTGYVSLAINMGNFGETYGLAVKKTDADGNWYWEAARGVTYPIEVAFELAEKEGYMAEYLLHDLIRTNNREDYSKLSDEDFANFREIKTSGVRNNTLYRTSSPINPELGRNTYADAALKEAGVTVIMNLADSPEEAAAYEGFEDSYYAGQKVIYLNLGVDFASEDFKQGLARGLKFFAENEGIYAVHCTEGKDRAGFVSALLECFAGASCEEVIEDYMKTYENYYGVETDSEKYDAIAESNIIKSLQAAFGVSNLEKANLAAEAEEYIKEIGLTDAEIQQLRENLCATAEEVKAAVDELQLAACSEMSRAKGRKAVKINITEVNGEDLDILDGYEIFRSTKRYEGYTTKPYFTAERTSYWNTAIKTGTRYYYKVRGYAMIDGEKYYTDWSLKAWRMVK